jgi:hypothetical protein
MARLGGLLRTWELQNRYSGACRILQRGEEKDQSRRFRKAAVGREAGLQGV